MRKILRRALVVVPASILALLLLVYALRGVLIEPRLKTFLVSTIESSLGPRVSIGDIDGSYLASLRLTDLRTLEKGEAGPLTSIEADSIKVRYSLLSLISGLEAFLGKMRIEIDGAGVELDLRKEGGEGGAPGEPSKEVPGETPEGPLELPGILPEVSIRDSAVSLQGAGYAVRAGGIRLSSVRARGREGITTVELGIGDLSLSHPRLREGTVSLSVLLAYDGEGITVGKVDVEGETLVTGGRIGLSALPDAVTADVQTLLFSKRLDLGFSMEESMLELKLQAEETDLGELFSVILLPEVEIKGDLSAAAGVRFDTGSLAGLEGSLSLDWRDAGVSTFSADTLEGNASAGKGRLVVERLEGSSEGNALSITDCSLSLDALFGGEWDGLVDSLEGAVAIHLEDLPGLLSQGGVSLPGMEEVPAHLIDLEGSLRERTFTLEGGRLEVAEGLVDLKKSSVALPPAGSGWGGASLHLDLLVDVPDLSTVSSLFPMPPLQGTLEGEVFLDGALDALVGRVSVESLGLGVGDRLVGDVVLQGEADSRRLIVHRGSLREGGGAGELEIRECSAPSRELFAGEWRGFLEGLEGSLNLQSSNLPGFLGVLGVKPPEVEVPEHSLELEARVGGGKVTVSKGSFDSVPAVLILEKGEAALPPADRPWSETAMEVSFHADIPDLEKAGEIFTFGGLQGNLAAELEIGGTAGSFLGSAVMRGQDLAYRGFLLGDFDLQAEADRTRIALKSLELLRGPDHLSGTGAFDIESRAFEGVSLALKVEEISAYGRDLITVEHGGKLEGSVELEGPLTAPEGRFEAALREGYVQEVEVPEILLEGKVSGREVVIDSVSVETSEGSLSLAGSVAIAEEEGLYALSLGELSLSRGGLVLDLPEPAEISWSSSRGLTVESLRLSGTPGSLLLEGEMTPQGESSLRLEVSGLNGEGWLEDLVGDRFTFSGGEVKVEASGPVKRPDLSILGEVAEFRRRGTPFPLRGEFDLGYSAEGVTIGELTLSTESKKRLAITGQVPYDPLAEQPYLPGEIALEAQLAVPDLKGIAFLLPKGYEVEGAADARLSLTGTWDEPSGDVELTLRDILLPDDLRPAPPGPITLRCSAGVKPGAITVREILLDSAALSAAASGSWEGTPELFHVIKGEEDLLQGEISLEGSLEASDIGWAARGIDALRSASGAIEATFAVEGPVKDPDVTVGAELQELGVRFRGVPPLSEVSGGLSLKGGTLEIPGLEGDLGGAPFRLAGSLSGIGEEELDFDLRLTGESLLLYRDEGVRVRADADLAARGPLSKLALGGSIMITGSHYVKNIDLLGSVGGHKAPTVRRGKVLFSFRDPPLRDLVFDLRLGTKDPFVIRNQFIRATVSPDLRLTGTGEEPALQGMVTIDEYRAQLPTGVMRGEQGLVAFREGEPRPWLEVMGETRMMGYDVTMQITGFADDPKMIFSSSPPLPGDEVLLMVIAGTPPRSSDRPVAASTGTAFSIFLAKGFLSRFFGGDPEATEDMILDRLETQVGRDITESGDPTIDMSLRLKEQFLLKGGTLYLTSEKDRYDDVNYGARFGLEFLNKDAGTGEDEH